LEYLLPRSNHLGHETIADEPEGIRARRGVAREHVAKVLLVRQPIPFTLHRLDDAANRARAVGNDLEVAGRDAMLLDRTLRGTRGANLEAFVRRGARRDAAVEARMRGEHSGESGIDDRPLLHPHDQGDVAPLAEVRIASGHRELIEDFGTEGAAELGAR